MPLELEVEVKTQKPMGEEDLEEMNVDRLIGKASLKTIDLNDEEKFEYRKFVFRLEDIQGRGDFDGVHTVVYVPYGVFMVRMQFDVFNKIYETMTGITLKKQSDFQVTKRRQ